MTGFDGAGLARLDAVMAAHVDRGEVSAAVWAVARHGRVHVGTAGEGRRDGIFRIASMTKPVVAVAALILLEECRLRLDDPVDDLLPELADRRVLRSPEGPLDDTEPARRPVTVADLLTLRLGIGVDFAALGRQPLLDAATELGLGTGPPAPAGPPGPDEWLRRLGTLPLQHHPGERWLYDTGSDVLGVLVARAAGQPLEEVLRDRLFGPLEMADTAFSVPPGAEGRLGPCHRVDPATGERTVYDPPDGQWSAPPAFPSGRGGLVSTVDDYLAFGQLLLGWGTWRGRRILSRPSVEAMTTNQLTPAQTAAMDPAGGLGWGFGVGVQVRRLGPARTVGSYGWEGGLGSSWANDPVEDLAGVLLTDRMWAAPVPPPVPRDFWACVYAALDG